MGTASSMLTQYDIEDVQGQCNNLFSQQEIVSLYKRFCQLDRNGNGFVSGDELMLVPEFALNSLSQRLLKMVDGLNFKDFVSFLSAFSANASNRNRIQLIFKVYDADGRGKVTFSDVIEVLRELSGSFMTDQQREEVLTHVLSEAGYSRESTLMLEDFFKVLDYSGLKMENKATLCLIEEFGSLGQESDVEPSHWLFHRAPNQTWNLEFTSNKYNEKKTSVG